MIPSTPMKRDSRPARIAFSDTITNEKANAELSGQRDRLDHDEPAVAWTASTASRDRSVPLTKLEALIAMTPAGSRS